MNKFTNDSNILTLQHALAAAKVETRVASESGCSDKIVCELMDAEDRIIAKLLSLGCHVRDC